MPCVGPYAGWTPCPAAATLLTVGGVDVSAQSLCLFHYELKWGQNAIPAGAVITDTSGGTSVDYGQAGLYSPPTGPFCQQAALTLIANRGYWARVPCPISQTITKIRFIVQVAATADDPCDVGIYAASTNPQILLGSSGSTTGRLNSTGQKEITLPTPINLVAGQVYYVAFGSGAIGGTAAQLVGANTGYQTPGLFSTSPPVEEESLVSITFPLPASQTIGAINNVMPLMALVQ